MDGTIKFDYYYGIEAEQFSFYRIPRLLIKDARFKELSSDAKLLYGLMLDRLALSIKNGWLDEENRVYIHYTLDNIMEDLGCAREKCAKVIAELDSKKGIGLIEKKRQGLGKPDIIYVKNFATLDTGKEPGGELGQPEGGPGEGVVLHDNRAPLQSLFAALHYDKKLGKVKGKVGAVQSLHNSFNCSGSSRLMVR